MGKDKRESSVRKENTTTANSKKTKNTKSRSSYHKKQQDPPAPPPEDIEIIIDDYEEDDDDNVYETEEEEDVYETDEELQESEEETLPEKEIQEQRRKSKRKSSECTNTIRRRSDSEDAESISGAACGRGYKKNTKTADEYEEDDDEQDEDYYPSSNSGKNKNMIILQLEDEYIDEVDENADEILNEDNDECDSQDEEIFMKETYKSIKHPVHSESSTKTKSDKTTKEKDKSTKEKSNKTGKEKDKSKKKDPSPPPSNQEDASQQNFEEEYKELVDLKKQLSEKLEKHPNSPFLQKSYNECCNTINKLVSKTRLTNTKEYYKLIKTEQKNTSELEYFKKKLSHKEQQQIVKDLDQINKHIQVDKPYRLTLLQSNLPYKYKATVLQKLNMLKTMESTDSEYHKIKQWVDSFMRIPFSIYRNVQIHYNDGIDKCNEFMMNAQRTLDECVYGLNDAKLQIMQLMGQWITNPSAMGTAIAIHGPPGTGKTALTKDGISKILGREFAFIALGGAGDGSFLEGHSYTYEGSTWGKIVQILMDSKCMNPIIYFDELDKISDSPRGQEIIGILTHLTDTTQNSQFHDKYFSEIDFDLSKCLFIFSYNDENLVNPILRDRMYRIKTKGYDTQEKTIIAKKYLLPKIREQVNFPEGDVILPDDTIQYIASSPHLTNNEQGVRNLKRCLEIIHTKLNLFRLMRSEDILGKNMKVQFPMTVTRKEVDILIQNDERTNPSLLSMYV